MALTKIEKEEALRLLTGIGDRFSSNAGPPFIPLRESELYKKLRAIIDQPSYGEGNEHLASNESSLSWERLVSMRDEANTFYKRFGEEKFASVTLKLEKEMARRLEKVAGIAKSEPEVSENEFPENHRNDTGHGRDADGPH